MTRRPTILLTGATSGIGLAAACQLATQNVTLILHGPEPEEAAEPALRRVRSARENTSTNRPSAVTYIQADFSEEGAVPLLASSVRASTEHLDVLVNNAGIPGGAHRLTGPWEAERTFGVNYLAGVLLTEELLPHMPRDARVVNVASATQQMGRLDLDDLLFERRPYSPVDAYAQSKLAIVTHSIRLAGHIEPTVIAVHPGVIATGLLHAMFAIGGDQPIRGGANVVRAITTSSPSGSYFEEAALSRPNDVAADPAVQERLRKVTSELLEMRIR